MDPGDRSANGVVEGKNDLEREVSVALAADANRLLELCLGVRRAERGDVAGENLRYGDVVNVHEEQTFVIW